MLSDQGAGRVMGEGYQRAEEILGVTRFLSKVAASRGALERENGAGKNKAPSHPFFKNTDRGDTRAPQVAQW